MHELTPFRDFNQELTSVFDNLQRDVFRMFQSPNSLLASMDQSTYPKMNIHQKDKDLIFEIALPSYHPEDVDISLDRGNILVISGKVSSDYENDKENYLVREVSHRAFSRSWKLPKQITEEQIEANYERGILKLVVKDVVESLPTQKRIPINIKKEK